MFLPLQRVTVPLVWEDLNTQSASQPADEAVETCRSDIS